MGAASLAAAAIFRKGFEKAAGLAIIRAVLGIGVPETNSEASIGIASKNAPIAVPHAVGDCVQTKRTGVGALNEAAEATRTHLLGTLAAADGLGNGLFTMESRYEELIK